MAQQPLTLAAGRRARLAELSFHPRLPGADQRRGRRHPTRPHRLPAAGRRAGAGQPRHPQQRLRPAAAAKRHPVHLRPRPRHQQFRNRVGQRRRSSGHLGALRFRPAPGQRRRRRCRPRAVRSQPEAHRNSKSPSPPPMPISRWSQRSETVRAAQAGVDRREAVARSINAPGATPNCGPAPMPREPKPNSPPRALN